MTGSCSGKMLLFARTNGAHVMIAAFQMYLLIVTLQSSTSLPAEICLGTSYPNGSVEFRVSTQGQNCSYAWLHNDTVIAYDSDGGRDCMVALAVAHTSYFLILTTPLGNISYEEQCPERKRKIRCICNCSLLDSFQNVRPRDDDGRHHYVVFLSALIVSGAVLGFLCKKKLNLCCRTTRRTAREQDTV